jgi:WD40 repeat protein
VLIPAGFASDGNHLVSLLNVDGRSGTWLHVLDLQTMAAQTLLQSDQVINVAALSPDGETAAWALPDFSVQLIRLPDARITATLTGHTAMVNALLFSPDGSRLYSASSDRSVIAWDTKKQVRQTSFQPTFNAGNLPTEVLGLGISPDGKTLITIPVDGSARSWDTATFKQVDEYRGSISGAYNGAHARYSPDGKFVGIGLSAGPGDTSLWRAADHRQLWSGGMMSSFDFSPDSRLFAHTELDEHNHDRIVVRSADGQTVYRTISPASDRRAWNLIFSPDSSTLVLTDGHTLTFWSVSDGRQQGTYSASCPD